MPTSQNRIDANRRNARKSTGPRTEDGKAASSRNAVTHGLYAQDIVLNSPYLKEDPNRYELFVAQLVAELRPRSLLQEQLVIKIANSLWRYQRVIRAEAAEVRKEVASYARYNDCPTLDDQQEFEYDNLAKHQDEIDSRCVLHGRHATDILRYELRLDRQLTRAYKLLSHLQRLDKLEEQNDKRNYRPPESPGVRRVGPDPYRYPDDPPKGDSPESVSGERPPAPAGPPLPRDPAVGNPSPQPAPSVFHLKPIDRTPPSEWPACEPASDVGQEPRTSSPGRTSVLLTSSPEDSGAVQESAQPADCTRPSNWPTDSANLPPSPRRRTKKRKNEPNAPASDPPFT